MLLWQFFVLSNGQILKTLSSHLVTLTLALVLRATAAAVTASISCRIAKEFERFELKRLIANALTDEQSKYS